MKKAHVVALLVVTFIVGMFAGGVAIAQTGITVFVNGTQVTGAIINQDRVYVPLRAVADTMGADVGWDAQNNTAYIASQRDALSDIEIVGTDELKKEIQDSLKLLQGKLPEEYLLVGRYLRVIRVNDYVKLPQTNIQTMGMEIPEKHIKEGSIWLAHVIVHEAIHSKQGYSGSFPERKLAEREAGEKGLETLKKLNAPRYQIEFAEEQIKELNWWNTQ